MHSKPSDRAAKRKATALDVPISRQYTHSSIPSPSIGNPKPPLSAPTAFQSGTSRSNAPKVAIPRLRHPSEERLTPKPTSAIDKNRVAHACEPCRHRKTKCSGEQPVCQHCQDFNLTCVYADGKRDRTKKQLGSLAGRVEEYERLLKDLSLRAGLQDQDSIRKALDKEQSSDDDRSQFTASPRGRPKESRKTPGEEKVSARVGSTGSMDRISEDLNRGPDARATGFYGKNSELTWVQRLKKQVTDHSSDDSDEPEEEMVDGDASQASAGHHPGASFNSISACSYHCDDLTLLLHEDIDLYELPPQSTANVLFQSYLDTVHPAFPIIGKNTYMQQYNAFFRRPHQRKPNHNWLAILNMIFAIGARYSHIVRAECGGNPRDDLTYFTRARMLGFDADAILGHAELQKVQITGLMAFYLMATNQINRSWTVSGVAIRQASTLGLNLRNESKDVSDSSKEIRCRVWWALCSTERTLAVMTGRPTSFDEKDCTAPLPLPIEEDSFLGAGSQTPQVLRMFRRSSSQESQQSDHAMTTASTESTKEKSTSSSSRSPVAQQSSSQEPKQPFPPCNALAYEYQAKLSRFTNEVLNRLYRAAGMSKSWAHVQTTISSLNAKLDSWRQRLPPVFDFSKDQRDQHFVSQRMTLGFSYYSTLILINRPCLCRIDRKIPDESDRAKTFNRETAARCVRAALNMLDLLPDEPNAIHVYKSTPWWCLVHFLMQAATVSMLELSFRADHMCDGVDEVFNSAKKALGWLRNLSEEDESARRASVLCNELLRQVAPRVGKSPNEALEFEPDGEHPIRSIADMKSEQSLTNGYHNQSGEDTHNMQDTTSMSHYQDGRNMRNIQNLRTGNYQTMQNPRARYPSTNEYEPQYGCFTSAPFQPQLFTTYDQTHSYAQALPFSAPTPFDDMFPTAMEIEGMNFDDVDGIESPNYPPSQNKDWFPGCGM